MSDDVSLHPGHLGLSELVVEPDQLAGGVSGGGQQPQVQVVAEVAVEGDDGQAGSDFVGEVAGCGHHLPGRGREPVREIFSHRAVEPQGGLLSRQGGEHVDRETLVVSYRRQDGNVREIFPKVFNPKN